MQNLYRFFQTDPGGATGGVLVSAPLKYSRQAVHIDISLTRKIF